MKTICKRTVVWEGRIQEVESRFHAFSFSGSIPCTGILKCLYCGIENVDGQRADCQYSVPDSCTAYWTAEDWERFCQNPSHFHEKALRNAPWNN